MGEFQIKEILSERYFANQTSGSPYIVAIDGLSGAGKTTFSKTLIQALQNKGMNTFVLHIDDYIVPRRNRYQTGKEEWYEYYFLQWDVGQLTKQLFEPLYTQSNTVTLPYYESATDSIKPIKRSISPKSLVIIEGVFLQRKEWREFYDCTIYLDIPRQVRYQRVLERDSYIGDYQARLDKYNRRYWPGEEFYLRTEKPLKHADYIIN
ncbi:Uridine kinase [Bacillus sp. THAF10]|uniref:kinase n=1 Tax=Bacillus sp. THAF10 TaxID=2587848 RepID=UPI001268FA9C|nr:kinase [Bacillus sp. THAF10]QFT89680.1 Uridine kinase [Bacillus sp. THAF10]